jgi:hypothetical protein
MPRSVVPRRLGALTLAIAASAAFAGPAQAALVGFDEEAAAPDLPAWFQDDSGLQLGICDTEARCAEPGAEPIEEPEPGAPAEPVEPVPTVYWAADANVGAAAVRMSVEHMEAFDDHAEFIGSTITAFAPQGSLPADQNYTMTTPYGTFSAASDGGGRLRIEELSCVEEEPPAVTVCDAEDAINGPIGPFLRQATGAPAGFVGDGVTASRVVGAPNGFNKVRIEGPSIGGPGVNVAETDLMVVRGQIDTEATRGIADISSSLVSFGARTVGLAGASQAVNVRNAGGGSLSISSAAIAGQDYSLSNACTGAVAAGQSCSLNVGWLPSFVGARNGTLNLASNTANGDGNLATGSTHSVALRGNGTPVPEAPAVQPAAQQQSSQPPAVRPPAARRASVNRLVMSQLVRLANAKRNGVSIRVSSANARRLQISISRSGRTLRSFTVAASSNRIQLLSRSLRRSLRAGTYVVRVTPIAASGVRGRTITRQLRVRR